MTLEISLQMTCLCQTRVSHCQLPCVPSHIHYKAREIAFGLEFEYPALSIIWKPYLKSFLSMFNSPESPW